MKLQAITAVSALALMLSVSAHAADNNTAAGEMKGDGKPAVHAEATARDGEVVKDIKTGLNKADAKMRETADDIKAFFVGDDKLEPVLIHRNLTSQKIIGQDIVNPSGKEIAKVKDIIVDKDGKATHVVVSDGGVLGIGDKVAAFDYNRVVTQKDDGKVVMALSQDMIDRAADFSYDQKDWAKAKVIPQGSYSVNEILKADVLDSEGKKTASVENVYFRHDKASQLIVGFNKVLGLGGDLAALDYDSVEKIKDGNDVDFKLSASQSAHFKNFKKSVTN